MSKPRLVIGNKNYSSWSLRPWLALKKLGVDFEEIRVALFTEGYKELVLRYSPAGKVPVYVDGDIVVWESLAILEHLAQTHLPLWPQAPRARAHARAIAAEMHAGFTALRGALPMNCRASGRRVAISAAVSADITRVQDIWRNCRAAAAQSGQSGPWLFGGFTAADAMYAPVAARFHTYGIACDAPVAAYVQTVLNDPCMQQWYAASRRETEVIAEDEAGAP